MLLQISVEVRSALYTIMPFGVGNRGGQVPSPYCLSIKGESVSTLLIQKPQEQVRQFSTSDRADVDAVQGAQKLLFVWADNGWSRLIIVVDPDDGYEPDLSGDVVSTVVEVRKIARTPRGGIEVDYAQGERVLPNVANELLGTAFRPPLCPNEAIIFEQVLA